MSAHTVTLQLSAPLERKNSPKVPKHYLSATRELEPAGFQTTAGLTAAEVVRYLANDPTLQEVVAYHVSEGAQERLRHLLARNAAGQLAAPDELELDEIQRIQRIVTRLKIEAATQLQDA